MKIHDLPNIKIFNPGEDFYNGTASYYKEYQELLSQVPDEGCSDILQIEMVRAICRLTYEYSNNGNTNILQETYIEREYECSTCNGTGYVENEDWRGEEVLCPDCGGSGSCIEEEVESYKIDQFYQNFFDLFLVEISKDIDSDLVEEIVNGATQLLLLGKPCYSYTILFNLVMYFVLNSKQRETPEWYLTKMEQCS